MGASSGLPTVFTVGHSNAEVDDLIRLLRSHEVEVVADVRSVPYSRHVPQFNRDVLEELLPRHGLEYVFMGGELGGRPASWPEAGRKPDYEELARDEEFRRGLEVLVDRAERSVVCLLCSEEDPARCHRGLLVGRVLAETGVSVAHIRHNGSTETQQELALHLSGGQLSLFPGV